MGNHLHFVFFSLAMIGRNIRQICQILLINWNVEKTQLAYSVGDVIAFGDERIRLWIR